MIKSDEGIVKMKGSKVELLADLSMVMLTLFKKEVMSVEDFALIMELIKEEMKGE